MAITFETSSNTDFNRDVLKEKKLFFYMYSLVQIRDFSRVNKRKEGKSTVDIYANYFLLYRKLFMSQIQRFAIKV